VSASESLTVAGATDEMGFVPWRALSPACREELRTLYSPRSCQVRARFHEYGVMVPFQPAAHSNAQEKHIGGNGSHSLQSSSAARKRFAMAVAVLRETAMAIFKKQQTTCDF